MNDNRLAPVTALVLRTLVGTLIACSCLGGCTPFKADPTATTLPTETPTPSAWMANPASVHCTEKGHTLEIRSDKEGNQFGVCVLTDGTECDEWAFFCGECGPGAPTATAAARSPP